MIRHKIKNSTNLNKITKKLKKQGKKIVFTNGCFDIVHHGHVKYLEQAKRKGDILVVGVNSDSSVRKIKGKSRPINLQNDRTAVIAALESVDYVTIFKETTPLNLIKKIKPDILVKGSDWKSSDIVGALELKKYGGKTLRVNLLKGYSTSNLIKKIEKAKKN